MYNIILSNPVLETLLAQNFGRIETRGQTTRPVYCWSLGETSVTGKRGKWSLSDNGKQPTSKGNLYPKLSEIRLKEQTKII